MNPTDVPEQATKILDREGSHIDACVAERRDRLSTPADAITATEEIFNLRRRYFGASGPDSTRSSSSSLRR